VSEFGYIDAGLIEGQTPESMGRSPIQQEYKVRTQAQQKPGTTTNYTGKVKFTDIFKGFKMTVNGITALFFIGYALWLVVIYVIRHNEPLANQVIGTPNAGAPLSHHDRLIVGGAKNALPINATGHQGFFTPDKKHHQTPAQSAHSPGGLPTVGSAADFSKQSEMALGGNGPSPISPNDGSAAYGHSKIVHYGRERVIIHHPEPLAGETAQQPYAAAQPMQTYAAPPAAMPQAHFGSPAPAAGFAHHQLPSSYSSAPANGGYNMPVQTQDGLKLRTVVSR